MIELRNICKTYKDKKKKKETKALKSINYKFGDTGLYFITGKSGSGKSTLLSILSGIDFNFEGDLFIENKSIKEFTKNDINYYRSSYLGFIFQDYNLIPELNAYDNVKLGFDVSTNDNEEDIHEIFKKLDIEELEERELNELSGGEKQRVAIARCLVKKPKVILADEPTGALDPINSKNIMDTLYELSKEYLVIVVTHNTNYLDEYESNKLYLDHGVLTTNDLIEVSSKEEYKSEKYKGLSNKLKLKLGLEILLHKKITLILSLFFIILSLICVSISISGMNYDPNYSIYRELKDHNDYVVARYYETDRELDYSYIPFDVINELEKYNQNIVYGFDIYQLNYGDENARITTYYNKTPRNPLARDDFRAFEYDDKSIDLFDLKIINGKAPETDEEILITDITCEYFINNGYSYNDISRQISTYDDMLGLPLFGFKISGVVSTNNSEFYKDFYKHEDDLSDYYYHVSYSATADTGCANAFFTKKKMLTSRPFYVYCNRYETVNYYTDVSERNDSLKNVEYLDGFDVNSEGIILSADYIALSNYGMTYNQKIDSDFEKYRGNYYYSEYTDEELRNYVKENIENDIRRKLDRRRDVVTFTPVTNGYSSYYEHEYDTRVIGISYDFDSKYSIYLNSNDYEIIEEYLSFSNAIALYSSLESSDKYFNLLVNNLKIYKETVSLDPNDLYLDNARASHIFNYENVFLALEIIFGSLGLIFFLISLFIMYKYINDSISYKEKDIGVLKSIGVSEKDIISIFNIQNLFIMSISLITSIIVQYLGVFAVNKIMSTVFGMRCYVVSYRIMFFNYLAIIFIAVIIPIIATLSPILKTAHKNPKDVLNNN